MRWSSLSVGHNPYDKSYSPELYKALNNHTYIRM